jgi:predicted phage terminase large subunit-like protein
MTDLYNTDTLDHLVQSKLSCFYEQSFPKFDAGEVYLDNWYIELLCEYLEAFGRGEIKNLNINIPPRFGKSALCNVAFSMWLLGHNPKMKIITISYGATLSQKLHGYGRAISNTSWYKRAFPRFKIDNSAKFGKIDESETKNTQSQFITTEGGFRIAASTNGALTGEGGNILIFDDLMNPAEALSVTQRESALNWTRGTAFSRFNNRKLGQKLNIQQRLGDEDFTGTFVDDGWENVIIPIQARQTKIYSFGDVVKVYKKGEFIEPRRYGPNEMKQDRIDMGSKVYEAQFFQETEPDDGEVFKKEWFKYWMFLPKMDYYAIYADTASKEGRDNDYTVFMCWGLLTKNGRKYAYLIDVYREKVTTPKLLKASKEFWLKHKNNEYKVPLIKFAVEDKSSGIGLIQLLEDETNIPVTKLIPEKDKVARANDILPRMESSQVLFPKDAPFLAILEKELLLFSSKKNNNKKDQVDTLTYAIKDLLFDPEDDKNKPLNYSALINEVNKL